RRIAEGFGVRAMEVDGTSFEALYEKVPELIRWIREGNGPVLIEAHVVRLDPHSSSDDQRKYRSDAEILHALEQDPLQRMEGRILEQQILTPAEMERLRQEVKTDVDSAAEWADAQPEPEGRDITANIFAKTLAVK